MELLDKIYELALNGFNTRQIYESLEIKQKTFYNHRDYLQAIKRGQKDLRIKLADSLLKNAVDLNNPTVQIFLAKKLRLFDDTFETITLKNSDDVLKATAGLYKAISEGTISQDKANQLQAILEGFLKAYEVNELERRIEALENIEYGETINE